eukprot:TRINITY_DN3409_c0_g1_i1.p1 TRINITY_DN3409_c0_g1~~TRINITY_DN3409_c0_g1_i1.p1  ORF type:complete len:329 (+),score=53.48 TRINITY_DN3409_c0_g1_i1:106-987(+)
MSTEVLKLVAILILLSLLPTAEASQKGKTTARMSARSIVPTTPTKTIEKKSPTSPISTNKPIRQPQDEGEEEDENEEEEKEEERDENSRKSKSCSKSSEEENSQENESQDTEPKTRTPSQNEAPPDLEPLSVATEVRQTSTATNEMLKQKLPPAVKNARPLAVISASELDPAAKIKPPPIVFGPHLPPMEPSTRITSTPAEFKEPKFQYGTFDGSTLQSLVAYLSRGQTIVDRQRIVNNYRQTARMEITEYLMEKEKLISENLKEMDEDSIMQLIASGLNDPNFRQRAHEQRL